MTSPRKKRVAVIGAGCAGLIALKSLLDDGHDACAFEQASEIGGLWQYSATGACDVVSPVILCDVCVCSNVNNTIETSSGAMQSIFINRWFYIIQFRVERMRQSTEVTSSQCFIEQILLFSRWRRRWDPRTHRRRQEILLPRIQKLGYQHQQIPHLLFHATASCRCSWFHDNSRWADLVSFSNDLRWLTLDFSICYKYTRTCNALCSIAL